MIKLKTVALLILFVASAGVIFTIPTSWQTPVLYVIPPFLFLAILSTIEV